jgi:AefR-like transcriptional repressor, C-terminal domain
VQRGRDGRLSRHDHGRHRGAGRYLQAAEQFVWLVVGAPLSRLSLGGVNHGHSSGQLEHIAHEAVETFLSRYGSGPLA